MLFFHINRYEYLLFTVRGLCFPHSNISVGITWVNFENFVARSEGAANEPSVSNYLAKYSDDEYFSLFAFKQSLFFEL